MESVKDRVVLVTGGGSGIGKATCLQLAKYGAKVAVADINLEEAQRTVAIINKEYPSASAVALKCNVSVSKEVQSMVESTVAKFGRLDGAVNSAGIVGYSAKAAEYSEEIFQKLVQINLTGVFLCMKFQIAQMLQQQKGKYSVVNISSAAGLNGMRLNAPYSAVKHGVIGLTKSTALDYARTGLRVNAVCPGFTATPMFHDNVDEKEGAKRKGAVPMGRLGTPDEVAAAIIWLLSDASSFTTGYALAVDGGLSCL